MRYLKKNVNLLSILISDYKERKPYVGNFPLVRIDDKAPPSLYY